MGSIIVIGNPFDGLTLFGDENGLPFENANEANEAADAEFRNTDWWVVDVCSIGGNAQKPETKREENTNAS